MSIDNINLWYNNLKLVLLQCYYICSLVYYLFIDPWLVACQVLYTMAAFITVFAFIVSVIGFFADLGVHLVAVPSFVQWNLIISTVLQLISVSVYGGKGIGNYSLIEPDYSLIIAGIATGLSAVCTLFFVLETECGGKNAENQEFISK